MKKAGQVVILNFPQTDFKIGKTRPALLIAPLPGVHDDWLVCMISTQIHKAVNGFDEIMSRNSRDFEKSGLKVESIIRVARIAIVTEDLLMGSIGEIDNDRLQRIKTKLAEWILE